MVAVALAAAVGIVLPIAAMRKAPDAGVLEDTVYDASRAVVPGAEVILLQLETRQHTAATTAADGAYQFRGCRLEEYILTAAVRAFRLHAQRAVVPERNQGLRANIVLEVGTIREELTI